MACPVKLQSPFSTFSVCHLQHHWGDYHIAFDFNVDDLLASDTCVCK